MWVFGVIVAAWTARVRRQRADAKAEATLARVDALTSLYNRRGLEEAMPVMVSHHRRHNRPLSVLVCDLDDFKGINDRHGHQTGDDTLRKVAQSLTAALRLSDLCYRWGGDEFVAVLPECAFGEASDIATRVRETVAAVLPHAGRQARAGHRRRRAARLRVRPGTTCSRRPTPSCCSASSAARRATAALRPRSVLRRLRAPRRRRRSRRA